MSKFEILNRTYLKHYGVKGMKWEHRKSDAEVAADVLKGAYGNGEARRAALAKAGYKYDDIQKLVNEKVRGGSSDKKSDKEWLTKNFLEEM